MSTNPPSNPGTVEEARAFVARVEALFMPWNIPALLAGFTDDCIVRFGDIPEFRGQAALERLFRARSKRQRADGRYDRQLLGGRVAGCGKRRGDGLQRDGDPARLGRASCLAGRAVKGWE